MQWSGITNLGIHKGNNMLDTTSRQLLTNDQFSLDGCRIRIPNLGLVRMRETLRFSGKILSATISRLSRAISDMGFFEFRRQLEYKAAMRGGIVVIADRFFASSKTCSAPICGHKVDKMPLSVREWVCPACGAVHDRDVNAAINLANYASAALSSHAVSSTVSACGGEGSGSRCKPKVKPAPVKQEFNAMTTFS